MTLAIILFVLATIAFVVNVWAAAVVSERITTMLKWAFVARAALALTYAVAYGWLVLNIESWEPWSKLLAWVGLLTWPVVWIGIPGLIARWEVHLADEIVADVERRLRHELEEFDGA